MSTIALPSAFTPMSCRPRLAINQRVSASPYGGSEQANDLLNDRWLMDIELPESHQADGAAIEAFINAMRAQVNVCSLYHFARTVPSGTMRGTPTLSGAHAKGTATLNITGGTAGGTLLAGDMLGVGGLLCQVATNITLNGSGAGAVSIVNRLRVAQSSGASVTWNSPTALFRMLSTTGVEFFRARASAVSFEFGEYIAP